jgi:hypothetical protein
LIALATRTDGEIDHMTVHDAVHWFTADETTTLVLAPADIPLLKSLWKAKRALIGTPRPTSLR